MKVFEIPSFGIENLRTVERAKPVPAHGQAIVRMTACSLNYRDLMVVKGLYNPKMPLPRVPLSDGCGVVEALGPGVTRVKPGDRVAGIFMQTWLDGGSPTTTGNPRSAARSMACSPNTSSSTPTDSFTSRRT
jgi:NADPH:quinone reductase-like Zn-dependent oxidoreductase